MKPFLSEPILTQPGSGDLAFEVKPQLNLIVGTKLMAGKLFLPQGFVHERHNHTEHESIGIVVSGRLTMTIGDADPVELGPGDTWHHPVGVYHSLVVHEDTQAVEVHSPLRADLLALLPDGRPDSD